MGHFYFLLVLWVLVFVSMLLSLRRLFRRRFSLPYVADPALFSPAQLAFNSVLERAVGKGYRIYGKVRAADVIGLRGRLPRADQDRAYVRLDERCFDFLVCSADTTAIVCAVNLAPRSRFGKSPPRKDVLDRICAAAGLPFVRIRESDAYSADRIAATLSAAVRAHQTKVREEAVPEDDAEEMLQGLSEVIKDRELGTRGPAKSAANAARPARAEGVRPPRRKEPEVGSKRRDPRISGLAEIDEGPSFKIDGDLEESRPLRRSRL